MTAVFRSTFALMLGIHLLMAAGCAARTERMTAAQRSERLAAERGRLTELNDPAARARSYIVISEILLRFAWEVVRDDELGDLDVLLRQYIAAVAGARDEILNSDRNTTRNRDGSREFERALRGQLTTLQDINSQLPAGERKPVEDTIAQVSFIRDELLLPASRRGRSAARGMTGTVSLFSPRTDPARRSQ